MSNRKPCILLNAFVAAARFWPMRLLPHPFDDAASY